jgi:hypothetical protein
MSSTKAAQFIGSIAMDSLLDPKISDISVFVTEPSKIGEPGANLAISRK